MNGLLLICVAFVTAEPSQAAAPVDFDTQILPVLTKAGCNAGACHGAAAGRGGMHLSLLGANPAADYETIVQALEGRRINLADPRHSLIVAKPTGQLDHGGDTVLDLEGPGARRLIDWIQAGALRGSGRRLTSLEVAPRRYLATSLPARVPLQVTARFNGGPPENVTPWTLMTSPDPAAVVIDGDGVAHVHRRGQHVVIARFLDRVIPIPLSVPLSDQIVDLSGEPRASYIDEDVLRVLSELRLPVAPPASDAAYLRRVCLDLTGRLPDPERVDAFLADPSVDKRSRLVEQLLHSEAFADYWTLRFARWLRLHALPNETEGGVAYARWLRHELRAGTGMDVMARELLTATGDAYQVGPANFGRMAGDARDHAELVGRFFLGVRLGCANCHNHPLDKWTQDDYHGLAAVFARLERGRHVAVTSRGAVTNLRTGEPAIPRIPGARDLPPDGDHRAAVAQWLTAADNRTFPRAIVNRLWRAMFGRGLVEPTDDLSDTNPATHPELLDRLADDFVEHGYNIRHTLRRIALSHTYGRSDAASPANARDDRFYSHATYRPLEPEVLLDAIADVTGVPDQFAGQSAGTRAIHLVDPLSPAPALDLLGRCSRAGGCEESPAARGGLATQLHLLNGDLINRKLSSPDGRFKGKMAAGRSDPEIVHDLYVRALGRTPTADELQRWQQRLAGDAEDRQQRLEDFAWSLLNSRQFTHNH